MSVSLITAIAAVAAQPILTIPLGKPASPVERRIAPVETAGPAFAAACKEWDEWDKPAPPTGIHGNTYLVGTCGISAVLIAGDKGHILIDTGTEVGAETIADNIRRLGFRRSDVKLILHSHEHHDHVGGTARLQQLTGAELVASPAAAAVFESGAAGPGDPQAGMHPPFAAVPVGRVVEDGETIRLGNLALSAVATPGHTAGALSWHWGSCDGGVCRRLVYADSLTPVSRDDYRFSDHPEAVAAFRASFAKIAALECDILLTPHPSASDMVNRLAGRTPLTNEEACAAYAAALAERLDERLAKEAAAE